jgi:hypothetical protein
VIFLDTHLPQSWIFGTGQESLLVFVVIFLVHLLIRVNIRITLFKRFPFFYSVSSTRFAFLLTLSVKFVVELSLLLQIRQVQSFCFARQELLIVLFVLLALASFLLLARVAFIFLVGLVIEETTSVELLFPGPLPILAFVIEKLLITARFVVILLRVLVFVVVP